MERMGGTYLQGPHQLAVKSTTVSPGLPMMLWNSANVVTKFTMIAIAAANVSSKLRIVSSRRNNSSL